MTLLKQDKSAECNSAPKQWSVEAGQEGERDPQRSGLSDGWRAPHEHLCPAHEFDRWWASPPELGIWLQPENSRPVGISVREGKRFFTVVGGTHFRIKKRHLGLDFSDNQEGPFSPDAPVIVSIKIAQRGDIISKLPAQLDDDRVLLEHQVVRIEAERPKISGTRRVRF